MFISFVVSWMALFISVIPMIERRLAEHNAGLSRYSSKKIPWEIFYVETLASKSEAIKRERFLKKQKNQDFN